MHSAPAPVRPTALPPSPWLGAAPQAPSAPHGTSHGTSEAGAGVGDATADVLGKVGDRGEAPELRGDGFYKTPASVSAVER